MTAMTDLSVQPNITNNCSLGGICGGCFFAGQDYQSQLEEKLARVRSALSDALADLRRGSAAGESSIFEGILPSPLEFGYRNKMEYSFGDSMKDGPLTLGLHKKKSFYDVVDVDSCLLVHEDCNMIVRAAAQYFRELGITYKDKKSHRGYLRYLLIRRAVSTGEMLIDLVTTSQRPVSVRRHRDIYARDLVLADGSLNPVYGASQLDEKEVIGGFRDRMVSVSGEAAFAGTIKGIIHTVDDSFSDAVKNDRTDILYGIDTITEELMGLKFDISPFSFFQTNTMGAGVLYGKVREYISGCLDKGMTVYDLYSGTGTIAQMLSPAVKHVTGVEIVAEAVEAARTSAIRNGLENCDFIAADVLKALDYLPAPDAIVLDPPREGVNPKALKKIIDYGVNNIIYVSCKPESLRRDLVPLSVAGYRLVRAVAIDQFPWTNNVETVCLLSNRNLKPDAYVDLSLDMEDYRRIDGEADSISYYEYE